MIYWTKLFPKPNVKNQSCKKHNLTLTIMAREKIEDEYIGTCHYKNILTLCKNYLNTLKQTVSLSLMTGFFPFKKQ